MARSWAFRKGLKQPTPSGEAYDGGMETQTPVAEQSDDLWYVDDRGVRHPRTFYGDVCFLPRRPTCWSDFEINLRTLSSDLRRPSCEHASTFRTIPDRRDTIDRVLRLEPDLRNLGVTELALFGSVARGDADWDSDVDVAVRVADFDNMYEIRTVLKSELQRHVDVVQLPLSGRLAEFAAEDLVSVFR